jgi:hypothetical protein
MAVSVLLDKATPANFELTFPILPTQVNLQANEELVLNIHGVVLPAINLNPIDSHWQGTKRRIVDPPIDYEILNCQFIVDSEFRNWKILHDWMVFISNNSDKMLERYANYAVDASLRIMDNFNNDILGVQFIGMWPQNLQEVSLSQKESEVLLESGATFTYDYFTVRENV